MIKSKGPELKRINYELFILSLSILSILNLLLTWAPTDPQTNLIVTAINYLISFIFLIDFCFRFFTAKSRPTYFFKQGGWADLISSFPFPVTYLLRLVRIVRAYRLLRKNGHKNILRSFLRDGAGSALLVVIFLIILVMQFGSIFIIRTERFSPQANITTAGDALWWTFVTITTVGYGDQYPVTQNGRFIGMLVMIVGVGLFGVLTGFLANAFLTPKKDDTDPQQLLLEEVLKEVKDLKKELKKKK